MKTYKEINDGIEVPYDVKEETLSLMKKKQAPRFIYRKRLIMACFVLLIAFGVVSLQRTTPQRTTPEKASVPTTSLQAYIYDLKDERYSSASSNNKNSVAKIAGEFQTGDIAGDFKEYTLKDFPLQNMVKIEQLIVPENFQTSSRYLTWSYEDQGPYPHIIYDFSNGEQYISAEIKDERIPNCIEMELPYKSYKGYDLCIYRSVHDNGRTQYNVYAKKDGFEYKVNAIMDHEEVLIDFVESFLI